MIPFLLTALLLAPLAPLAFAAEPSPPTVQSLDGDGWRIADLISKNYMALDLEKTFVDPIDVSSYLRVPNQAQTIEDELLTSR